jgi:hypothetical protein
MRSHWVGVGPKSSITGVLVRKGHKKKKKKEHTGTDRKGRRP